MFSILFMLMMGGTDSPVASENPPVLARVRTGEASPTERVLNDYGLIGNLRYYAGELIPFINSAKLRKHLDSSFTQFTALEIDIANRFGRLQQDQSDEGRKAYAVAIEELARQMRASENAFVQTVLELSDKHDLRLFVMVVVRLRQEDALPHPFCQSYWGLSEEQLRRLNIGLKQRKPFVEEMRASIISALAENKPAPTPSDEDLAKRAQLVSKCWNELSEGQLTEFLRFSGELKPNQTLLQYLKAAPAASRTGLVRSCNIMRTAWENQK